MYFFDYLCVSGVCVSLPSLSGGAAPPADEDPAAMEAAADDALEAAKAAHSAWAASMGGLKLALEIVTNMCADGEGEGEAPDAASLAAHAAVAGSGIVPGVSGCVCVRVVGCVCLSLCRLLLMYSYGVVCVAGLHPLCVSVSPFPAAGVGYVRRCDAGARVPKRSCA